MPPFLRRTIPVFTGRKAGATRIRVAAETRECICGAGFRETWGESVGASVCKKCRRAYPKYLEKCPNCHPAAKANTTPLATNAVEFEKANKTNASPLASAVPLAANAPALDGETTFTELIPGHPCPLCGHKVPKTGKQRYAEWKARQ